MTEKVKLSTPETKRLWKLMEDLGQQPVALKYDPATGKVRIMSAAYVKAKYGEGGSPTGNSWDPELHDAAQ